MRSEGIATDEPTRAGGERLLCYRHPQRETYVRCGRCDRPICSGCAMQGPVGLRCKQCGTPAYDPLTAFTPMQLALAGTVAGGGGLLVGLIGAQIGLISIILAFIAGGFIAEGVRRIVGYKRGRLMMAVTIGGILAGAWAGYSLDLLIFELAWVVEMEAEGLSIGYYLPQVVVWGLVDGGVAGAGAYYRLR